MDGKAKKQIMVPLPMGVDCIHRISADDVKLIPMDIIPDDAEVPHCYIATCPECGRKVNLDFDPCITKR